MNTWAGLAALLIAALQLEAQSPPLRIVGDSGVVNAVAVGKYGAPAYPVTLLKTLGARVADGTESVSVQLFGDALRFYPGWSFFLARGRTERLATPVYRHGGVLHLPQEFFTRWLPQRYPDRVRHRDGTVSLLGAAPQVAEAADARSTAHRAGTDPKASSKADDLAGPADQPEPVPARRARSGFIWLEGRVSSTFDSNIDHAEVPTSSVGSIALLTAGLQTSRSNPVVQAEYRLGSYNYTNSERWDRITQDVAVEVRPSLSRAIRLSVSGEIRRGSRTDDRERADQWILAPAIELDLSRTNRLTVSGAHQQRTFPDRPDRNAINRLAAIRFRHAWRSGPRWEAEGRYEVNAAERDRSRYTRWAGRTRVQFPLGRPASLTLGIRYSERRYGQRLVELNGTEVIPEERRWEPGVTLYFGLPHNLFDLALTYEFLDNQSDDFDGSYQANRVELTLRRRFY